MKRRRAREHALQMLYQSEFSAGGPDYTGFWADKDEDADTRKFAEDIVRGTINNLDAIDARLSAAAEHWVLDRMAAVDRNILRAAAYEIMYRDDIPAAVAINEALEIAKRFSSTESASFINGILDRIAHGAKKP